MQGLLKSSKNTASCHVCPRLQYAGVMDHWITFLINLGCLQVWWACPQKAEA